MRPNIFESFCLELLHTIKMATLSRFTKVKYRLTLTPPFGISIFRLHRGHGNEFLCFPLSMYRRIQLKQKLWRQESSRGSTNLSLHRPHFSSFLASCRATFTDESRVFSPSFASLGVCLLLSARASLEVILSSIGLSIGL